MTKEFEADLEPRTHQPRIRLNFANGWSASVIIRTRPDQPPPGGCEAMQAMLACCPTGKWGTGCTEGGETEATADEVAGYLAEVAVRPRYTVQ